MRRFFFPVVSLYVDAFRHEYLPFFGASRLTLITSYSIGLVNISMVIVVEATLLLVMGFSLPMGLDSFFLLSNLACFLRLHCFLPWPSLGSIVA